MNKHNNWRINGLPMLIAEIGGNHEGDFNKALKMLELAIRSGVDCVKFQLYSGDSLVNKELSPSRNLHFKKFELTKDQHIKLAKICFDNKILYNASVWDLEMLDWIDEYLSFYKIGSGDLTAWPIIREFALRNKPIILSTGLSSEKEVLETIDFIQKINPNYHNPEMLCILQCTSMYPIPNSFANLNVMDRLKSITGLTVGYSDHTICDTALKTAATMGASVLEFHFTDNRQGKDFRDHQVSLTCDEVLALKKYIKTVIELKGDSFKSLQSVEIDNNHHISFRRGIYTKLKIKKGEILNFNDLVFLRPCEGTSAKDFNLVVGAKAIKDIEPLFPIKHNIDFK